MEQYEFYDYVDAESEQETLWADIALGQASDMVSNLLGAVADTVPVGVVQNAEWTCAAEIYFRQQTKFGTTQFADGSNIRIARDPMQGVYPILAPYLGGAS